MKNLSKEKILWTLFGLDVCLTVSNAIAVCFHSSLAVSGPWYALVASIPVALALLHAIWTLGKLRGIVFFFLAGLAGFIFETIGLKNGTFFGGQYVYQPGATIIGTVPIMIIVYWAVFIYLGYAITTSFLYWSQKEKPIVQAGNGWLLPLLVLADGIIVTAIDLFMDPLEVKAGMWTWLNGGPYFGVPIGNFIGWFIVACIVTAAFRLFEFFFSPPETTSLKKSVFLIPLGMYLLTAFSFSVFAVQYRFFALLIIGLGLMGGIGIINLVVYFTSRFFQNSLSPWERGKG